MVEVAHCVRCHEGEAGATPWLCVRCFDEVAKELFYRGSGGDGPARPFMYPEEREECFRLYKEGRAARCWGAFKRLENGGLA